MEIGLNFRRKGIFSLKVVLKLVLEDFITVLARGEDESVKEGVCFYSTLFLFDVIVFVVVF